MKREENSPPLFNLRFMKSESDNIYYRITVEGADADNSEQVLCFNSGSFTMRFIEPYFSYHQYLASNEKWLRSILYTTLKIKDRETISIPFSFPEEKQISNPPENSVRIYCDGSCSETGSGGWGAMIIFPGLEPFEISGEEDDSTSNRMELAAAVQSLLKAEEMMKNSPHPVVLFTDSNYVIHGVSHRLQVWKRNGFITALGTPVINREIWEELASIIERVEVHCVKVYASDNDPYHRRCDELAGIRMRRESF